jgi:2'-5' RNA ligase
VTGHCARLFFALWPAPPLRDALAAWARDHAPERARPVPADNLHLTLAYLGPLPAAGVAAAHAAGAGLRAAPVTLTLTRVEHWARPRLLCAVPDPGPDPLAALAAALSAALVRQRLPVESRPFRSHVTLVRKVARPPTDQRLTPALAWHGDRLALVASESPPGGVRYRELAGWPLGAEA